MTRIFDLSIIRDAALLVYLPQGMDSASIKSTVSDDQTIDNANNVKRAANNNLQYAKQTAVLWTSFLGLPNQRCESEKNTSAFSIFKNFLGWEDGVSLGKKTLNGILALPVFLPYNLIRWAFCLFINIVSLFTEFLPRLLDEFCLKKVKDARDQNKSSFGWQVGSFIATMLLFSGRSLSSPVENIRLTWMRVQAIALKGNSNIAFIKYLLKGNPKIAKVVGAILCGLSAAMTVAAYTAFFIFAAPALIAKVVPVLATKIIPVVANALVKFGAFAASKIGIGSASFWGVASVATLTACAMPISRFLSACVNAIKKSWSSLGKLLPLLKNGLNSDLRSSEELEGQIVRIEQGKNTVLANIPIFDLSGSVANPSGKKNSTQKVEEGLNGGENNLEKPLNGSQKYDSDKDTEVTSSSTNSSPSGSPRKGTTPSSSNQGSPIPSPELPRRESENKAMVTSVSFYKKADENPLSLTSNLGVTPG